MKTLAELLQTGGIDPIDARVLLRAVLGVNDAYLIAHARDQVNAQEAERYRALVARRVAGEPVAYILGEREFFGRVFAVSPAVLIPRPETELLVELALQRQAQRVLDVGTGSGCIAISIALERSTAQVVATDCSPAALEIARENARRLHANNVQFIQSNWFSRVHDRQFDLIVANPPYVAAGDVHLTQGDLRFEPTLALVGAGDGLDDIRTIVNGARAHLAPGGSLLIEHGYDQAARVRALLEQAGFIEVQSWRDLAGIERVSGGCAPRL